MCDAANDILLLREKRFSSPLPLPPFAGGVEIAERFRVRGSREPGPLTQQNLRLGFAKCFAKPKILRPSPAREGFAEVGFLEGAVAKVALDRAPALFGGLALRVRLRWAGSG